MDHSWRTVHVNYMRLLAIFHRVDVKIISLQKQICDVDGSKVVQEIGELAAVQTDLKNRTNTMLGMFLAVVGRDDEEFYVRTVSKEGFAVVMSAIRWFLRKQNEMDARADRLLDLKGKQSTKGKEKEKLTQSSDKNLSSPMDMFAHRLSLSPHELSVNEWKVVEGIFAESVELTVEISLLLVELYLQLLPRDKNEGMSYFHGFLGNLSRLAKENANREVVKWIRHVVQVADEELRHVVVSEKRPPGKSEADEVQVLLRKLMNVILELEDVNNFCFLMEITATVNEAVRMLELELKFIRNAIDEIKQLMEERNIRLKFGFFAPLIIWTADYMCFEDCIYRGELR